MRALARALACALAATVAVACGQRDPTEPLPLYTVIAVGGTIHSAAAGSELDPPLAVEVRDPTGLLAKGVAVRFEIVTGRGATLSDTLVATDGAGIGMTRLRLGGFRDSVVVTASVRGQEDRGVVLRITATAPSELTSIQPSTFAPGDTVVLRGSGLAAPGGTDVTFAAVRGRLVGAPTDSMLRVVVPPCLPRASVLVAVRTGSATTNGLFGLATTGVAPLVLQPNEGITVRGSDAGCLLLANEGERYLLVPQFASYADSIPSSRPFSLAMDAPNAVAAAADNAPPAVGTTNARTSFEAMLRATESSLARQGVGTAATDTSRALTPQAPARSVAALVPAPPAVGSRRSFHVLTRLDGTAFATATAKLRFAGANILLYEDSDTPSPLTDSTAIALGDLFDHTLYRLDVDAFGAESDIDGNGRVIVLVTPLVNALTGSSQCGVSGYVPGYFYGVDLDTRNRNSNRAEIFYAFAPDPQGQRSCPHRLDEVLSMLPGTFMHEFQHMISFNQHVIVRKGPTEMVWLNEGLSHVAEELAANYFDALLPAPAGRVQPSSLLPDSAMAFIRGNLENAALYLSTSSTRSVTAFQGFGTLEERGAAWLFLRWLGAQKGAGVYSRLVQSGLRGGPNVEAAAGEPFTSLFGDFALSLYADSIPGVPRSSVPARFRAGTRSLRELFSRAASRASYPLTIRPAPTTGGVFTGNMVQGTATYFLLTVPAGGVSVRLTGPANAPISPALAPQLGVLRLLP